MNLYRWLSIALTSLTLVISAGIAQAEISGVRVAMQFGLTYLPIMIMQEDRLIEKHAKAAGLGDVELQWLKFSGGNVMNDATCPICCARLPSTGKSPCLRSRAHPPCA